MKPKNNVVNPLGNTNDFFFRPRFAHETQATACNNWTRCLMCLM